MVAVGLSANRIFQTTKEILHTMPFLGRLLFHYLPAVLLCLAFAVVYRLILNTRVHCRMRPWWAVSSAECSGN